MSFERFLTAFCSPGAEAISATWAKSLSHFSLLCIQFTIAKSRHSSGDTQSLANASDFVQTTARIAHSSLRQSRTAAEIVCDGRPFVHDNNGCRPNYDLVNIEQSNDE